jgi:hypothetical protein
MRLGNVFAWAAMAAGWAMILLACIRGRGLTNPVEAAAR